MNNLVPHIQQIREIHDGRRLHRLATPLLTCLLACTSAGLFACSSDGTNGSTNMGGNTANGGTTGTGGTSAAGGASGTGGTTSAGSTTGTGTCPTNAETKFSFFLISNAALQTDSGSDDGYGGDLGGLAGADAICQRVAQGSSACQSNKTWHAFLSTSTVNAKDRIGNGPWYDRIGRLLATNLTNLLTERPTGADVAIVNDLPNENGVPNHNPDKTGDVDNHEILTGTGVDGVVYNQDGSGSGSPGDSTSCGTADETWTVAKATCWDWTSKDPQGCPRVGHSWPRAGSGNNWMSVWNAGGCAPGGSMTDTTGLDGTRCVGSAGGYGGFYCFAVTP